MNEQKNDTVIYATNGQYMMRYGAFLSIPGRASDYRSPQGVDGACVGDTGGTFSSGTKCDTFDDFVLKTK